MAHNVVQSIFREADNAWIPLEVANIDYQSFITYLDDNDLSILDLDVLNIHL